MNEKVNKNHTNTHSHQSIGPHSTAPITRHFIELAIDSLICHEFGQYGFVCQENQKRFSLLTYKNKNRRIRLWVKMYSTLPVNGSITGNRWIRLVINIRMASYNDASGPMLTSGIT